MHYVIEKMTEYFPKLNKQEITEEDCWEFVRKRKILVKEAPLFVNGYYGRNHRLKNKPNYILIDRNLRGVFFLKAFLHEIGHACLHEPRGEREVLYLRRENAIETKQDKEADLFMLLALLPLPKFLELRETPPELLHPFTINLLVQREELYAKIKE